MQERSSYDLPDLQSIRKVLPDENVGGFLLQELHLLPKGVYDIEVTFSRIYINLYLSKYHTTLEAHHQEEIMQLQNKKSTDIESRYALRISRNFPLPDSVRLHLLDGGFQPKISDCRDFFLDVMGKKYDCTIRLAQILNPLVEFDKKLHHKNELFLQMQRMGYFVLGETYYYHELVQLFSSLILMKDLSHKKHVVYVGVTETHILLFREIQQGKPSGVRHSQTVIGKNEAEGEATFGRLLLVSCAQLQCIDTIFYRQSEKTIKIILKRYKSIKLYHESEDIKKQYRFAQPQLFLRGVLKYISKFQTTDVIFEPCLSSRKGDKQMQQLGVRIEECNKLEEQVRKQVDEGKRKQRIQIINKHYQKLIEYYSARANPYYLIYVNKLNSLYLKYYINTIKPKNSPTKTISQ